MFPGYITSSGFKSTSSGSGISVTTTGGATVGSSGEIVTSRMAMCPKLYAPFNWNDNQAYIQSFDLGESNTKIVLEVHSIATDNDEEPLIFDVFREWHTILLRPSGGVEPVRKTYAVDARDVLLPGTLKTQGWEFHVEVKFYPFKMDVLMGWHHPTKTAVCLPYQNTLSSNMIWAKVSCALFSTA